MITGGALLGYRLPLVVIDGSSASHEAVALAGVTAVLGSGRIVVASIACEVGAHHLEHDPSLQYDLECYSQALVLAVVTALPNEIPVTTVVTKGRAGPAILRCAVSQCCDSIILGLGEGGSPERHRRRVTRYLVRHAAVPVLAVEAAGASG